MIIFKKLIRDNVFDRPETTVIIETESVVIKDVIEDFKRFLLACGYQENNINEHFGDNNG